MSLKLLQLTREIRGRICPVCRPLSQFLQHSFLVRFVTVQFEYKRIEPGPREARSDYFKRGELLRYEQNSLPFNKASGDEVRNRLRLAGTRRPLDDEVFVLREHVD